MKKYLLLILSVLFLSFDKPADKKWVSLFNGKNLDNWVVKVKGFPLGVNFGKTFRASDGILSVRYDEYDSFRNRFGGIYYKKKFTNYRLKLEYRFVGELTKGAPVWGFRDSGVQYQCQDPKSLNVDQSFPICLEYNLKGGNGTEERPTGEICLSGTTCEIDGAPNKSFCNEPTVKKTFHGDQWVTLEIDVNNGVVKHFVNGEEVLTFAHPKYDPKNEIAKTLIKNGDDRIFSGYISLQSNSHPIDFRNIQMMEY